PVALVSESDDMVDADMVIRLDV
ncbi:MAG: hypothetical protein QOI80_736, partial [Solirubrobacteraceae bacterium]|nr:hypothetical protein [Solirubrobacteraceae bacterium]